MAWEGIYRVYGVLLILLNFPRLDLNYSGLFLSDSGFGSVCVTKTERWLYGCNETDVMRLVLRLVLGWRGDEVI